MTREETVRFISEHEILPASKFGQNFLCDEKIISDIISLCGIEKGSRVIEIGPGIGALTRVMADMDCDLTAVEIDRKLADILASDKKLKCVEIVSQDFLKYEPDRPYDIAVSNIPYYVMTPIILRLIICCPSCNKMVFMVEEEAIRRINAPVGTKQYGPLSVMCSLYGTFRKEFTVPRDSFVPAPHTSSAVITLTRDNDTVLTPGLLEFIELAFRERRKKMINSLSGRYDKERLLKVFEELNVPSEARAESLSPKLLYDVFFAVMQ